MTIDPEFHLRMATNLACAVVTSPNTRDLAENNSLNTIMRMCYVAVANAVTPEQPAEPEHPKATPSEIRKSITADHLVSFEDDKRYKSLKRHLRGCGLTPEQYREKWGLPSDYPMVAPNYSAVRSQLAKNSGLGTRKAGA